MDLHLHHGKLTLVLLLLGCADPASPPSSEQVSVFADAGADFAVPVGEPFTVDGTASSPGTGAWDFGDGTVVDGALAIHTYNTPGNYVAVLQITSEGGLTRTDAVAITAYLPASEPRPQASSSMWLDEDAQRLIVAVPESNALAVLSLVDQTRTMVEVCERPRTVSVAGDALAVACEASDELRILDATSLETRTTWDLGTGTRPFGVVGDNDSWWVGSPGRDEVLKLSGTTLERIDVPGGPRHLAIDGASHIWAPRFRSDRFGGSLSRLTEESTTTIPLERDPGPDSDTASRGIPNLFRAAALSPDGGTLYLGGLLSNVERGIYTDGNPLTFESTVRAQLRMVDTAQPADRFNDRKSFDDQGDISALAVSPLGNWVWVAHQGTQTIHRLDAWSLDIRGSILAAGHGLDALQVSADGERLYAYAWLDRQVHAWDIQDVGTPRPLWSASTVNQEPLSPEVLWGKQLFHDASDPRIAKDGYLACTTCHPDGRHDGMVWDFTDRGEGLRNTISLEGHGGLDMGRLHWSGNFDEIQDFEQELRHGQSGRGFLTDDQWSTGTVSSPLGDPKAGLSPELDALAAYVSSLDVPPESPWGLDPTGEALFFNKQCTVCHPVDEQYTDSGRPSHPRHDVGTLTDASGMRLGTLLDGLDTPTLLGVWSTAPYLHDGSARNLEAAIGAHTINTPELTPAEIVSLATYVRGL